MNDNFYVEDLLQSLREDTTVERYWRLIPLREELLCCLKRQGVVFRDDVTDEVMSKVGDSFGSDTAALLARFLHLYDFGSAKLRELKQVQDGEKRAALSQLLRLPGVRLLRAELYYNSGVTLEVLAQKQTEEIRSMVREYTHRESRGETVPFVKEVNCHREVAKMILHIEEE